MSEHTIASLCQRSRDISLEKGWLNPDGTDPRPFHTVIALFHSELSEAFEDIRSNKEVNELYYEATLKGADGSLGGLAMPNTEVTLKSGELLGKSYVGMPKPCGFPVELADFVIRVAQYYGSAQQGLELSSAVTEMDAETVATRGVSDDAEELITQLHANVSLAYISSLGKGPRKVMEYLALALVVTFDFCKKKSIDLWSAIDVKEAYNRTRPQKHGGKKM